MADVLGLVPVLGRESMCAAHFNGRELFWSAVDTLTEVANPPVMLVSGSGLELRSAVLRSPTVLDMVECPRRLARLRSAIEATDLVVVHDPLCPLVSAAFIRRLLRQVANGRALVGVRPVVDTVKTTLDGSVSGTVNRDEYRIVASPLVCAGADLLRVPDLAVALTDLSVLVDDLRRLGEVELVVAPSASRRIEDDSGLSLLASVDAVTHRVRER